ncbi:nucleoside-diphosphate-sugar epimerase [Aspergillus luchuensis]|uniref:Nucleoside-diphosphate-sugar epimerase n=1 Tax=Aspergillus kawachii TaxID=1069201 RepID=A0A146FBK7_ASPKA|nr:nucleoside-diphosphate-sugar epimerase [Aspergillus luchuensis]
MKIILTGSTGFIGHEILTQCLRNPHITSIIALSRRPLPTNNPKLTVRLVDGFLTYPESLLQELRGAEAFMVYVKMKDMIYDTNGGYEQGQVENELTDYEKNNNNVEVYIARPGMVLARGMSLRTVVFGMGPSIWVDDLAKVLVDVAVKGDGDGERILENERMLRWEH